VGIRSLDRPHSYPDIRHHTPARIRYCCNHRIRIHLAGTGHIAVEDIVEAEVDYSLAEDQVVGRLSHYRDVVEVGNNSGRRPCWHEIWIVPRTVLCGDCLRSQISVVNLISSSAVE
jgi:hypothetical protein